MLYETLGGTDSQVLYHTFKKAFSDYPIDFNLTHEKFEVMLKRRGFVAECSVGAFTESGHELVGFILNGVREWNGKLTAYDLGTGIVPAHRKHGVTPRMFQKVREVLLQRHVEQYLLEVLKNNPVAFALYQKLGLTVTRYYSAYGMSKNTRVFPKQAHGVEVLTEIPTSEWTRFRSFWDFAPSWQNSIESVCAVPDRFAYAVVRLENQVVGYGIVEKDTGDIPLLAVQKEHRHKGIATSIVAALQNCSEADSICLLNINDACDSMKHALPKMGFSHIGAQYEMMLTEL